MGMLLHHLGLVLKPVHAQVVCCSIFDIRAINQMKFFILADSLNLGRSSTFSDTIWWQHSAAVQVKQALVRLVFPRWRFHLLCDVPPPISVSSSLSMLSHARVVNTPGWILAGMAISSVGNIF